MVIYRYLIIIGSQIIFYNPNGSAVMCRTIIDEDVCIINRATYFLLQDGCELCSLVVSLKTVHILQDISKPTYMQWQELEKYRESTSYSEFFIQEQQKSSHCSLLVRVTVASYRVPFSFMARYKPTLTVHTATYDTGVCKIMASLISS